MEQLLISSSPCEVGNAVLFLHAERIIGGPAINYPHQWPMLGGSTWSLALRLLTQLNSWSTGYMWGKNIKVTGKLSEKLLQSKQTTWVEINECVLYVIYKSLLIAQQDKLKNFPNHSHSHLYLRAN